MSAPVLQPLLDTLARVARQHPQRIALKGDDGELRYGELARHLSGHEQAVPGERRVLPVVGAVRDVVRLLALAAQGHSTLVLDAAATPWERERAARFRGDRTAPALGLCTSGTTGLPQVVELDWDDVLDNARAFGQAAGFAGDVIWCSTPLHHRYCLAAGVLGGLLSGATVLLTPGLLGPAEFARRLLAERVTVLLSVPFLYSWYVQELVREPATVQRWSVRCCIAAGEPLPPDLARRWRDVTGLPLVAHYGSTEDGQITLGRGAPDEGVGLPLEGVEVTPSDTGELLVRRRAPGALDGWTAWRRTGDSGRIDGEGNVHITGRASERLNVAGKKIDPVEVEQALGAHRRVADAVVAGVPGRSGEEVVAFLVADGEVTDHELRRHLGALLSPHKVPRRFVRIPEVPRTRTGKPRRGVLVAGLLQQR